MSCKSAKAGTLFPGKVENKSLLSELSNIRAGALNKHHALSFGTLRSTDDAGKNLNTMRLWLRFNLLLDKWVGADTKFLGCERSTSIELDPWDAPKYQISSYKFAIY